MHCENVGSGRGSLRGRRETLWRAVVLGMCTFAVSMAGTCHLWSDDPAASSKTAVSAPRSTVSPLRVSGLKASELTVSELTVSELAASELAAVNDVTLPASEDRTPADPVRDLQMRSVQSGKPLAYHWGPLNTVFTTWGHHSNRLIPVYTFGTGNGGKGVDLDDYTGVNSAYRREEALKRIYGRVPSNTLQPNADYMDQTDIAALQRAALTAGKKYIFLVVFDGMDWQTTRAAAIYNQKKVTYDAGRGTGTHFQEYTAQGTTQFGFMVTSPANDYTKTNVDKQLVINPGGVVPGGYNPFKGGPNPWTAGQDPFYPICRTEAFDPALEKEVGSGHPDPRIKYAEHAYPDSSATATAMCAGVKTFNNAVNVDYWGQHLRTVAHEAQAKGYAVGAVTSVPISHATPSSTYAHNVDRDDFQDLTRDMLGLPSISHPEKPLPGMDVVIGGGYGEDQMKAKDQGENFVPGNIWITANDLRTIQVEQGGKYVVATRQAQVAGRQGLMAGAKTAAERGQRFFGFYGGGKARGHLPFQTANGDYQPTLGRSAKVESYTEADLFENPTLADMTSAALLVLGSRRDRGFWLMVEAGDVDWANHDNNLDNSIGAVNSGDAAVKVITDWVEKHSNWQESVMIVTADHGHYLVLDKPELLAGEKR